MAFMEVKFEQMREESEGLKRKLKRQDERQVKFSKKGHEVQYEFNNEVLEAIEAIQDGLERQHTTKAKKLLEELAKKVSHRNKLIKIADRSKFGWLTVAEYQKDQLAEDSDDEKGLKTLEKTITITITIMTMTTMTKTMTTLGKLVEDGIIRQEYRIWKNRNWNDHDRRRTKTSREDNVTMKASEYDQSPLDRRCPCCREIWF